MEKRCDWRLRRRERRRNRMKYVTILSFKNEYSTITIDEFDAEVFLADLVFVGNVNQ